MDKDFSIGQRQFKLGKINALKQFHIVRRIAPILAELAPNLKGMAKLSTTNSEDQMEAAAQFLAPIMVGISKLSDKDSELVLFGLLESIEMKQDEHGNWAKIARDGQLLFENIDLGVLMQAAGRAFMYNLSSFFAVLPQVS